MHKPRKLAMLWTAFDYLTLLFTPVIQRESRYFLVGITAFRLTQRIMFRLATGHDPFICNVPRSEASMPVWASPFYDEFMAAAKTETTVRKLKRTA